MNIQVNLDFHYNFFSIAKTLKSGFELKFQNHNTFF